MLASTLAGMARPCLTEIWTSACQPFTVIGPTLPTTTSSILTGEFDSSVLTFAISTWYLLTPPPAPAAPGNGNEFRPWNAHPVAVTPTQHPMASTRRTATRPVTAVALPQAAACPASWAAAVAVVAG